MQTLEYQTLCDLNIKQNIAHVWFISPVSNESRISRYLDLLDFEELTRAYNFHFKKDQLLFLTSHIALRLILGKYLNTQPDEIRYSVGKYGKPFIEKNQNPKEIFFNLSHTSKLIAIGISKNQQIGIDVEFSKNKVSDEENLMSYISTREEFLLYTSLSASSRQNLFYKLWTRKEALLKACGLGLNLEPNCIFIKPAEKSPVVELPANDSHTISSYTVKDFNFKNTHTGAVALPRKSIRLKCLKFQL